LNRTDNNAEDVHDGGLCVDDWEDEGNVAGDVAGDVAGNVAGNVADQGDNPEGEIQKRGKILYVNSGSGSEYRYRSSGRFPQVWYTGKTK
jgi:hypothetical protein